MKKEIKDILKAKFSRDVGALQVSTVSIALITTITSLTIAKALKPADFGVYSLVLSIYSLLAGGLGNLGIRQTALVKLPSAYISRDKNEVYSALGYYFKASLIVSALIMAVGYATAPYLSQLLYARGDIGRFLRVLFLMPPLAILYKLVTVVLEGTRNMAYLAVVEAASALIRSFILIALAVLCLNLAVLIYGWLISTVALSAFAVFLYKKFKLATKELPSISEIVKKSFFAADWRFLKFNLSMGISENMVILSENLPIVLLGMFVLPGEVGYFKLGYGIMGLSALFLEPIARNLLVKLRQLHSGLDKKGLRRVFYKVSLYSGIISSASAAIIIILSHFLIRFFWRDYEPGLKIIYMLAVYFCLTGFGIGLSPVLRALECLRTEIRINAIGILILTISSALLVKNSGALGMAAALAISCLFTKFMMYMAVKKQLGKLADYAENKIIAPNFAP